MSNTRTAAVAKKATAAKKVKTASGETIALITPIPGGLARWHKPGDLTPRKTRELEIIGAELLPRIGEVAVAQKVYVDGRIQADSDILTGKPVGLSRDELRSFLEFQEACAWAFLESWTLERPLPATPDDYQDLPRPLYNALMEHAAKLAMAGDGVGFTVNTLPDEGEADPDLPT